MRVMSLELCYVRFTRCSDHVVEKTMKILVFCDYWLNNAKREDLISIVVFGTTGPIE